MGSLVVTNDGQRERKRQSAILAHLNVHIWFNSIVHSIDSVELHHSITFCVKCQIRSAAFFVS